MLQQLRFQNARVYSPRLQSSSLQLNVATMSTNENIRLALVTYGTTPVGKAIVHALAQNGISVIFTHQSEETQQAASLTAGIQADLDVKIIGLELASELPETFEGWLPTLTEALIPFGGKLDYLVNLGACGQCKPFHIAGAKLEDIDYIYTVAFKSVWHLTSLVLPFIKDGKGVIINMSSGLARYTNADFGAYAALKGGLSVWNKYLANEVGGRGIRAVGVAAGLISTENGGLEQDVAKVTALDRVGKPEDVGNAVVGLIGIDWVNGTTIEVSGGQQI